MFIPAILESLITTPANYHKKPNCLELIDPDPEKDGKKSEHKIVVARAITEINNNAFPQQCPRLGIQSYMKNGVRPTLIPVLVSYSQERETSKMYQRVNRGKDTLLL